MHRHVADLHVTFDGVEAVSATFTGGTSNVQLTVSVPGPGR